MRYLQKENWCGWKALLWMRFLAPSPRIALHLKLNYLSFSYSYLRFCQMAIVVFVSIIKKQCFPSQSFLHPWLPRHLLGYTLCPLHHDQGLWIQYSSSVRNPVKVQTVLRIDMSMWQELPGAEDHGGTDTDMEPTGLESSSWRLETQDKYLKSFALGVSMHSAHN